MSVKTAMATRCRLLPLTGRCDRLRKTHGVCFVRRPTVVVVKLIHHALRSLVRRPSYTVPAIATLALGMGATTAIYSFVDALLLRPFPFPEAERLLQVHTVTGGTIGRLSAREVVDLNDRARSFSGFAGYFGGAAYNFAGGDGPPVEIPATITTRNLFEILGVSLALGEAWPAQSDRQRSFDVVISHDLWRDRFGSDPGIIGKQLQMDAAPYTIYGVGPVGLTFPTDAGIFRCQGILNPDSYERRENRNRSVLARLQPGVSLETAERELAAIADQLAREFPETNTGVGFTITPLRELYLGDSAPYLIALLGAVGLVLLTACVNVINLTLARAQARWRESAVRVALGASGWDLARQPLVESLMIAAIGGLIGWGLSYGFLEALTSWVRVDLPPWMVPTVDGRALLALGLVTFGAGLITGLLPVLLGRGDRFAGALKEGGRGSSGGRRWNQALVVVETASALVLLIGAGLLLQSVLRLHKHDVGFDPSDTLVFRVALPWAAYDGDQTREFYRRLVDELGRTPGVEAVELNNPMPLSGSPSAVPVAREGQGKAEWVRNPEVRFYQVSPGFHETFSVPLVAGRRFTAADDQHARMVCLVSQTAARRFWPGEEPLGKRLMAYPGSAGAEWMEVVGVVGDVKHDSPDERVAPALYAPFFQRRERNAHVSLKALLEPSSLLDDATRVVWSIDPEQSIFDAATMDDHIGDLIWQRSIVGRLFGVFAALALVLALVGLYGVISYSVAERRWELGIRAAVGADPGRLIRLVLRQALGLALGGVVLGGLASLALARALQGLLFEVSAADPVAFVAMPATLLAAAVAAALLPAMRAAQVDPIETLRES